MKNKFNKLYIVLDIIASLISWTFFFSYRKFNEFGSLHFYYDVLRDNHFFYGLVTVSFFWILLYFYFGFYTDVFRKSRIVDFWMTFIAVFSGVLFLFVVLILDDKVSDFKTYYLYLFCYLVTHLFFTLLFRTYINIKSKKLLRTGVVPYISIIIGDAKNVEKLYAEIEREYNREGHTILGFVGEGDSAILTHIGVNNELNDILSLYSPDEVIIASDSADHLFIYDVFNQLTAFDVLVKISPDMYDIMSSSLKTSQVLGPYLIEIYADTMPEWEKNVKLTIDYLVAIFGLILLSPFLILIAVLISIDSKGGIFYRQERIGYKGRRFNILKFRSMISDSEKGIPQLSSKSDSRITKVGRILRKYRLDELPQLLNILKGDMSIIGYRPERDFFINQIVEVSPYYQFLYKIKPGLTSLGMVKYGYAENVDQMIQRLKFDMVYLRNRSLSLDFKIMLYTIEILYQGRGK
jgi:polysaccharide biosynthesis protein PslA